MAQIYPRHESRSVRPFYAIDDLADMLQLSEMRCFDDEAYSIDESRPIQKDRLPDVRVSVRPKIDQKSYRKIFPDGVLGYAVIVTDTVSKKTSVTKGDLDLLSDVVVSTEDLPALVVGMRWHIDVVVFLRKRQDRANGMPYLQGHCVSRKRFSIELATDNRLFDIRIRTDDEWRRAGLPARTLYYIDGASGMNSASDYGAITLWLHASIAEKMQRTSRNSAIFTKLIVPEILCSTLSASFPDWREAESPEPQSPLETFVRKFEKHHKMSFSDIKAVVASGDVSRIRALLQSDFGTVDAFEESR